MTKNYVSEGVVQDNDHYFSNYFGVLCSYTSTRSDKFFFDDLVITGDAYFDNDPPDIDSIAVLTDSSLHIFFNEKVTGLTAGNTLNYTVDQVIGNPSLIQATGDSSVLLYFQNQFIDKTTYQLSINGVEDLFSNSLNNFTSTFTYNEPYIIGFGDVLITEIMADPTPGVDLPEYEYLELHNPTTEIFKINDVKLIVGNDTTFIPDLILFPNDYLILCQYAAVEHFVPYGTTLRVPNWPSLNNNGEPITLLNQKNEVVFSVEYANTWYRSIDKDDGGWSLEMIDTSFPCKGSENWRASRDPSGGTPGRENSSDDQLTDLSGPEISKIIANSTASVIVYLNEKIGPEEIPIENISIGPTLDILNAALISPGFQEINIVFNTEILPKTIYQLSIKDLNDCTGNIQQVTTSSFVLPEPAESLELIINEILFSPAPGGVDFVEIYNQSPKYIDVKSLTIGNADIKPISTDHFIIKPEQFIALTEDTEILINHYPGTDPANILQVDDLPSFNDDEGNVFIADENGKQLDFFHYSDGYHSDFLQETEGVSLERISFDGPTNNRNNWQSAASTAGYATPGTMNSQFFPGGPESDEVTVEPKVFDPGNNGFYDFATIKCRFPTAGNMANIQILDAAGRKIKTILSHKSIGTEEDFKWEGMNEQGQEVRMGPYIVYVEIYNASGKRNIYRRKVVVGTQF